MLIGVEGTGVACEQSRPDGMHHNQTHHLLPLVKAWPKICNKRVQPPSFMSTFWHRPSSCAAGKFLHEQPLAHLSANASGLVQVT